MRLSFLLELARAVRSVADTSVAPDGKSVACAGYAIPSMVVQSVHIAAGADGSEVSIHLEHPV